jgi:hypothetical protein
MRKASKNHSFGGGWLLAASLAVTLAAFGCSSNQYAGNGQPSTSTPGMNHSSTYGSSSGTEGNPPMASSYYVPPMASSYYANTPAVDVDALANAAARRGYRGIVLGPTSPNGGSARVVVAGGQFENPAALVNPQSTVNSSISSAPTPAITGGPIGGTIDLSTGVVSPAAVAGATTIGTTSAAIGTGAATGALTTTTPAAGTSVAGSAAFSPVLMNSTPAPQATGTANATLPTVTATGRGPALATAPATVGTTAAPATVRTLATQTGTVAGGIHIQTTQTGGIMVTNVGHAAATTNTTGH